MSKKIIVITGVTGGVGSNAAQLFIDKGWIVIGLGRNMSKLKSLKNKINHSSFYYYKTDIKKYKSIKDTFNKIKKNFKTINVLVNNAAIFNMKSFDKFTEKEINDIIDTNLKGTIFCTLECLKIMKSGKIINIGSVSGIHGIANQAIYSASKYGINGFAESLNQEIIKKNIKISSIIPGGINTPLWNKNNIYPGNTNDLLDPSDISEMIYFIVTSSNKIVLKNVIMFPDCEWH